MQKPFTVMGIGVQDCPTDILEKEAMWLLDARKSGLIRTSNVKACNRCVAISDELRIRAGKAT